MRYAVIGSRDYPWKEIVEQVLEAIVEPSDVIVSGGARGVDWWGEQWAKTNEIETLIFPAKWIEPCDHGERHKRINSRGAPYYVCQGFNRNSDIIANSDVVLAFVSRDVGTSGTNDSLRKAKQAGKTVKVFGPDGSRIRGLE